MMLMVAYSVILDVFYFLNRDIPLSEREPVRPAKVILGGEGQKRRADRGTPGGVGQDEGGPVQAGEDDLRHVRANSLMAQTLAVYLGNGHMRPLPPPGPVRMRRHPGSEGFPEQEERPNVAAGVEP